MNGLIPSPKDNRDYALSNYIPSVKRYPKEKPLPFDLFIHNQMIMPSCVGMTCATVKEGNERMERVHRVFDGNWLYHECKKIDGIPNTKGTYLRTGLKILKDLGAKPLNEDENPSKYRIKAYARVDDMSFEGLKKALSIYHFLIGGFRGSSEGWRKELIRPPKEGESVWGHAVALVGYDEKHIIGQNSWGDYSWTHGGSGGYFKTKEDYLPFEAWAVLLDAPNEPKTIEIEGYVASEFVRNMITTHNLNMRHKPSLDGNIITTLPKGTKIKSTNEVTKADGYEWIPVLS